jgi:hypothetical protein
MWQDIDGNGIRTGVDAPGSPSPLTVELYTSGGAFVTSTAIGGGPYSFMGIPSGSYYLKFSDPGAGWIYTLKDIGGDDSIDSDVNVFGQTDVFSLLPGQTVDILAGWIQCGAPLNVC